MALTLASAKPWYDLSILGPYSIAIATLNNAGAQVLGVDNARSGVIFHNPGSANKRVLPVGTSLAAGSGGILIYPQSDFILLQQENSQWNINCAWQAVTDDNTDGSLTILNFTPNTPNAPEVQPTMRVQQQIPVASPLAFPTITLGTGSIPILGADPNRNGVIFNNPGTVIAAVCPANLAAAIGAGSIILLPGQTKEIIGNDRVKVNCGWNGIAQSGNNNALTALGLYG
jgi:hypothetical protein